MKHFIVLLAMLLNIGMIAQVEAPVASKKALKNLKNNLDVKSLLWKVEAKKSKHTSYVYGTIHMIPEEDFFWPPNTKESLDECDRLTLEIDMAGLENDMGAQMSMMMNILMKNNVTPVSYTHLTLPTIYSV